MERLIEQDEEDEDTFMVALIEALGPEGVELLITLSDILREEVAIG